MKKNAMLKIAAILLVAVLLTTCAISSTFAKYVSAGSGTYKTARVAKWGLDIVTTTNLPTLTEYNSTTSETEVTAGTDPIILAPGSQANYVAETTFTGDPEVAFKLETTATVELVGWTIDDEVYFPVEVTVGTTKVNLEGKTTLDAIETAIADTIKTLGTKEYAADATLTGEKVDLSIKLAWAFGDSNDVDDETNVNDTALGDLAAESSDSTIAISITQTATQLD